MLKINKKIYPFYIFLDLVAMSFVYYTVYVIRCNFGHDISYGLNLPFLQEHTFVFILWSILVVFLFKKNNLYVTDRSLSIPKEMYRVFVNVLFSSVLMGCIIFFAKYNFFTRTVFFVSSALFSIALGGWRLVKKLILRHLIIKGFHNVNVLIVGAGRIGSAILNEIKKSPYLGFNVVGFLDDNKPGPIEGMGVLGPISAFEAVAKKYFVEDAIVTIPSERKVVSNLIRQAKDISMGIRIVPENFEEPLPVLGIGYLGLIPLITYRQRRHHPAEFAFKRLFDFTAALFLSLALIPVFFIIAVFIKINSKGPVFYIDRRIGLKNTPFNLYKFRSMILNAAGMKTGLLPKNEVKDGVIFKMSQDPRVTRIGKFLRRFSLDELPQLFNVIKGDMALVGPRPPLPEEVEKYTVENMRRLSIRPGITGLSQIKARDQFSFARWVRFDIWYMNHWSFGLDMNIIWWTFLTILRGKGV
ncbi:MAG: sugar transferase [Candidatus Omnitrophica bacterium]|jgi:exopolysaccharide biosynthesis polyprenyl glycosylphosphotransferase|nr:sugar transferase [Candidatus Omnitrophota bacterium]